MSQGQESGVTRQSQRMGKIGPTIRKYMFKRVYLEDYLLVIVIFSHTVLE